MSQLNLVSCFINSCTVIFDRFQNLICRFGPYKRFWILVVDLEVLCNCDLQFFGTAMGSTPDLIIGNGSKPAFHKIHPRGTRWCEVKVKSWTPE